MNRYIMIHHLRWPVILLLIGTLALLDQLNIIQNFWSWFWPLLLIGIGLLMLAERAALASMDSEADSAWPFGGTQSPCSPSSPAQRLCLRTPAIFGRHSDGGNQ